jgi:hypothetical protein
MTLNLPLDQARHWPQGKKWDGSEGYVHFQPVNATIAILYKRNVRSLTRQFVLGS